MKHNLYVSAPERVCAFHCSHISNSCSSYMHMHTHLSPPCGAIFLFTHVGIHISADFKCCLIICGIYISTCMHPFFQEWACRLPLPLSNFMGHALFSRISDIYVYHTHICIHACTHTHTIC